jgi:hypothetical protein
MNSNQINVIRPYKYHGQWVFDDPAVDLEREAFVAGMDTMLDVITGDIPDAGNGFICLFSSDSFPGHTAHLKWKREDPPGNTYEWEERGMEGWLCPALGKYYESAPRNLYFQVKAGEQAQTTTR